MAASRRRGHRPVGIGCLQPAKARAVIRHPLAWGSWATAALAAAFIDRNPFLQVLLLLIVINVFIPYRREGRFRAWKIGPALPIIGGRWTLEAAAFGASTGVALLLTVGVFGVVQTALRSADLVAILPRPFYRAGTTVALAIAFAPKTVASLQSIREARQLRGQRAGWRSAPQLLLPLLLTSLERALQYGESLDARGFGSGRRSRYRPLVWTIPDVVVAIGSLAALTVIVLMPAQPYNPYVSLLPGAPAAGRGLSTLVLALPAITVSLPRMGHATHHD